MQEKGSSRDEILFFFFKISQLILKLKDFFSINQKRTKNIFPYKVEHTVFQNGEVTHRFLNLNVKINLYS